MQARFPALIISTIQSVLGLASGMLVGFSLGLVGGGGSILAVPLMVYVVGVPDAHVAIGTSAVAVAANAAMNLSNHARGGSVRWSCALVFAAAGIAGAFAGSIVGKMVDGQKLLALFALLMLVIAALMLKTRSRIGVADARMSWDNTPAVVGARARDRNAGRLLRHRRRLPDRAGPDAGDRDVDHECDQLLAGRRHRIRPDHGCELRLVRAGLLAAGRAVRCRRHRRRIDRHPLGAASGGPPRRAQHRVLGGDYCGGALYAGAQLVPILSVEFQL